MAGPRLEIAITTCRGVLGSVRFPPTAPERIGVSQHIQNGAAVHRATSMVRQIGDASRRAAILHATQRRGVFFSVVPATPGTEPTTEPDETSMRFDVVERYTLLVARPADDLVHLELLDEQREADDKVVFTGGGNNAVEGLARIMARILLGEDPYEDDMPDYT